MNQKEYLKKHEDKVLCYIEDNFAYFTSDLDEQWGDDWDDQPYEHNAGIPYEYDGISVEKLVFESYLETPADLAGLNSSFSVKDINEKKTPWLRGEQDISMQKLEESSGIPADEIFSIKRTIAEISTLIDEARGDDIEIYAGTSMSDFIQTIKKAKGEIYLKI